MLEQAFELCDPATYWLHHRPMILSKLFLSRSRKRADDLHDFWNLRVFAALVLEEEEMKAPIQRWETLLEMCVGVAEETDLQEIERQGQATRL